MMLMCYKPRLVGPYGPEGSRTTAQRDEMVEPEQQPARQEHGKSTPHATHPISPRLPSCLDAFLLYCTLLPGFKWDNPCRHKRTSCSAAMAASRATAARSAPL
jgi:hypothetical protein